MPPEHRFYAAAALLPRWQFAECPLFHAIGRRPRAVAKYFDKLVGCGRSRFYPVLGLLNHAKLLYKVKYIILILVNKTN